MEIVGKVRQPIERLVEQFVLSAPEMVRPGAGLASGAWRYLA
jgi:hypothetical protein